MVSKFDGALTAVGITGRDQACLAQLPVNNSIGDVVLDHIRKLVWENRSQRACHVLRMRVADARSRLRQNPL